jgi:hypothetical protein
MGDAGYNAGELVGRIGRQWLPAEDIEAGFGSVGNAVLFKQFRQK